VEAARRRSQRKVEGIGARRNDSIVIKGPLRDDPLAARCIRQKGLGHGEMLGPVLCHPGKSVVQMDAIVSKQRIHAGPIFYRYCV
jgi:hypothetical protein